MVSLVISTYHMGRKWAVSLSESTSKDNFETINTWEWLQVLNWIIGIISAISCLIGLVLMAYVAIGIADSNAIVQGGLTYGSIVSQSISMQDG